MTLSARFYTPGIHGLRLSPERDAALREYLSNTPEGAWTPEHQLALLHSDFRSCWGGLVLNGVIPAHPLNGTNLIEMDLKGVDLSWAQLTGTCFRSSDIRRGRFCNAWAYAADFELVRGVNASFSHIHAKKAFFDGASLNEADFRYAVLREARFSKAKLNFVDFRWADLRKARFFGASLHRADLTDALIEGADFTGADLEGARMPDGWAP